MVFLTSAQHKLAIVVLALMVWGLNFFLHFFWEMMQAPFFVELTQATHAEVVWLGTRAAIGDAFIALIAYTGATLAARNALWPAKEWPVRAFVTWLLIGILITLVVEVWATDAGQRLPNTEAMSRLPQLNIGLLPVLQWLVIPILSLFPLRWLFLGWCQRLR
ncbi:hypothetical protein QQM79_08215 [Marinobacteraceae bacterium S3BR75-40.1]